MEDTILAAEAGADAIGLNFFAQSPRYITPQLGRQIRDRLEERLGDARPLVVGVFVNAGERLADVVETAKLDAIQLHGDETPSVVAAVVAKYAGGKPVIRAFRCRSSNLDDVGEFLAACGNARPTAVLLDAYQPGAYGGTGQRVDWDCVRREQERLGGMPIILAGGLNAENVAQAIATASPAAVDTASGVESSPGKKDPQQVRAFVEQAKRAFGFDIGH